MPDYFLQRIRSNVKHLISEQISEYGQILAKWPKIQNLMALCALELSKFKKWKYLYFFVFWPFGRDKAIFMFFDKNSNVTNLLKWSERDLKVKFVEIFHIRFVHIKAIKVEWQQKYSSKLWNLAILSFNHTNYRTLSPNRALVLQA